MALDRFQKLIRCLSTAHQDSDIDCGAAHREFECLAEQAIMGTDIHIMLPQVAAHLDCCRNCREEYDALVAILRAETQNNVG
jgi:hypothetical protein